MENEDSILGLTVDVLKSIITELEGNETLSQLLGDEHLGKIALISQNDDILITHTHEVALNDAQEQQFHDAVNDIIQKLSQN